VRYKKFENDYWGTSIKELISKSNFDTSNKINFSSCGINNLVAEKYLKKKGNLDFTFVNVEESDYIIMTNRAVSDFENNESTNKIINCFDKFNGKDIFSVKRNGLVLSKIKKRF